MFHLTANQCSYFFQDSRGPTVYRGGGGGSNIVIFQGGPDSLPHTPSHHHHTHLDQQMPMSDILIALLKASKERRYWLRVKANWNYCASFSFMIKQVRGGAEFVCDENDQRLFTPNYQIKLWSYGKICIFIWLSFLRRGQTFWIRRITWTGCDVHFSCRFSWPFK